MGWNYLIIPKLPRYQLWSWERIYNFIKHFYWCNYLSMLRFWLINVSKMAQEIRITMNSPEINSKIVNTLRPRKNGRHFPDDIFKCIFFNENVWISIKSSLKFDPKVLVNNIPALVLTMVGAVQATSHYLNQCWLVYWRIYASLGLNEFNITLCP